MITRLPFRLTFVLSQLVAEPAFIIFRGFLYLKKLSLMTVPCIRPIDVFFLLEKAAKLLVSALLLEKNMAVHPHQFIFMVSNHLQQSHRLNQSFSSLMVSFNQYLPT